MVPQGFVPLDVIAIIRKPVYVGLVRILIFNNVANVKACICQKNFYFDFNLFLSLIQNNMKRQNVCSAQHGDSSKQPLNGRRLTLPQTTKRISYSHNDFKHTAYP